MNHLDALGIQPLGFVGDCFVAELEIDFRHINMGGIVHGGVICSLLDTVLARSYLMARPEGGLSAATLEMKVNFLRSVKEGRLKASGRVVNVTRRTAYVEGTVEDGEGRMVARGSATLMVFSEGGVR
jgi:uncharacterized protein (TIGR00369 family)